MPDFWGKVTSGKLAQGDWLFRCGVPIIPSELREPVETSEEIYPVEIVEFDVVIMTQSCDLENDKTELVACCPIYSLAEYEKAYPDFEKQGEWEQVRRGRVEGLHLLPSPDHPDDKWQANVVDFRSIYSLPVKYLEKRAADQGFVHRLQSPFLEHFSQAFARFFMRVGLPSAIESYSKPPKRPPAPQTSNF